jgi:hypothetical protein
MITDADAEIEELRRREFAGEPLTAAEQAQLADYYRQLEETEMRYLAPAIERLETRQQRQEEAIARLEVLRDEKIKQLAQIRSLIQKIEAIETEEKQLLAATKK